LGAITALPALDLRELRNKPIAVPVDETENVSLLSL
jgi:hypothetical protein